MVGGVGGVRRSVSVQLREVWDSGERGWTVERGVGQLREVLVAVVCFFF